MHAIEAQRLVKRYGEFAAVNDVEFQVTQGEIFGFLGPNGAGKSTTINMLCTLLRPTAGTATINGHDVVRDPGGVRQSIGIIFQDASLDDRLTGRENLKFHALLAFFPLRGVPIWLSWLSRIDPVTHGVDSLRQVALQRSLPLEALDLIRVHPIQTNVAVMAGLALAFIVPAVWLFGRQS